MERMFKECKLDNLKLANRFIFPPVKTGYGIPGGKVTDRQLNFYRNIAKNGPGVLILEPVSVTPDGKEHPKQLCVHLPENTGELKKIADVIHKENRLACLHLNHAGAGANPKASGTKPKAPSVITCPTTGQTSEPMTEEDIENILAGYKSAAQKAVEAGFDMIEIQAGHGYLVSQFLNKKINKRTDSFGLDRLLFAKKVVSAVREGALSIPCFLRISGNEMSPEFGIDKDDLLPVLKLAEESGICAVHVGMGASCFSPPWYFHHSSLPEKPQVDSMAWVREHTSLPLIIAGRMGRKERVVEILNTGLADLVALGRPLIADPDLIEKWQKGNYEQVKYCGYCLQGCLHRLKGGEPLGCNLNPGIGLPDQGKAAKPLKVLVAGGGPGGMSAALYLSRRGHKVTLAEKEDHLGGQFALAWQAPGKEKMREGLEAVELAVKTGTAALLMGRAADMALVKEIGPDLLVWAAGAVQNTPKIQGLENQYLMTSLEYFQGKKEIRGPRVLVIGAGRTGIEIAEKLGREGFEVTATKRTDPIGSMMEMISKNLALKRIGEMKNITIMPHTTVKAFKPDSVEMEQDGEMKSLLPFQTVILASGMLSAPGPGEEIMKSVPNVEIIGDALNVQDIFSAVHAGYQLADKY
ncbi:NADH:flavin oxidoreductase [Desulfonema limicola]|uniref:NADH:flavin oxidoreductase n=1 Tax=Desulfonema limicola TaxID=45656 RepID=A0A975B3S6_9BACT|nr:FAD-dependent oxidoreductase [Desulfonema limicola]QTA78241.1 NADH:flavin oxidoreductase [Desulfonema limicola]